MGKQVNFYMTDDDEREVVAFVRASGNIAIFKSVQTSPEILELVEMPPRGEPFWFALYLWNKDVSPIPKLNYIKEQDYYAVEEMESEVIQFHRCGMDAGRLVRGRLWAQMSYWRLTDNSPAVVNKSDAFSAWYERLANWIKRHSTRNDRGEFVMPGAARFVEQGGMLCQAVMSNGSAL
jgi:hypothetical protein